MTDEDVENGELDDDQIQAMWGTTLEEAQDRVFKRVVAVAEDVDVDNDEAVLVTTMLAAIKEAGGKTIDEPDL